MHNNIDVMKLLIVNNPASTL